MDKETKQYIDEQISGVVNTTAELLRIVRDQHEKLNDRVQELELKIE